ncbi:MAG: hypothetical protein JO214_14050 [Frankiaceae bacterium]|nr:hypothetical protein [Frankiaceae bacterium]
MDPALEVVAAARTALLDWFKPDSAVPARVGTTTTVRAFAGDGAPLTAWDSHASESCSEPFVWTRLMRRYRSQTFPSPTIDTSPCKLPRVVAVEIGVGWCAYVPEPDRVIAAEYEKEAEISGDTSWRMEEALCMASALLRQDDGSRQVGTDTIAPYGPEGGVIAWTGVLYATY